MNTNANKLRCERLQKSFGGIHALSDVTLGFPPSGITAIIGPNGAGKTTLINVLTGFLRSDEGRCYVGEQEVTRLSPHKIARLGVARTFQELRLISLLSLLENVMVARPNQCGERLWPALFRRGVAAEESRNREEAMRWLRFVGLGKEAEEPAGGLSYGQQKLLTLAVCLATEAQVLLLDEPMAGVHPEMVEKIVGLLRQLRDAGKLIVFIEHDLSAVRQAADHVIVMDDGRVIAQGKPGDVLERPEILEAYLT